MTLLRPTTLPECKKCGRSGRGVQFNLAAPPEDLFVVCAECNKGRIRNDSDRNGRLDEKGGDMK